MSIVCNKLANQMKLHLVDQSYHPMVELFLPYQRNQNLLQIYNHRIYQIVSLHIHILEISLLCRQRKGKNVDPN